MDFAKTFSRTPFSGAALNREKCKMIGVLHKQLSCKKLFYNAFVVKNLENYLSKSLFLAKLQVLTLQFLTTKNTILRHTHTYTHTKYCFTFLMFKHPAEIKFSKRVRTQ